MHNYMQLLATKSSAHWVNSRHTQTKCKSRRHRYKSLLCVYFAGNAWTDPAYDNQGAVDFWWTHALISDDIRNGLLHDCNFSGIGPLASVVHSSVDDLDKSKVEVSTTASQADYPEQAASVC